MKKILAVALTGVFAVAAFAIESDPSNTVGFISQTLDMGFSPFSPCPVGVGPVVDASDYIAGQGTTGDVIYKWELGGWFPYNHNATWAGLTFDAGIGYLYANNSGAAQSLVIAGDVIPEGTTVAMGTLPAGTFQGWGNPLPMDIDLDTDDLGLGLVANDVIYNWEFGGWFPYTHDGTTYALDLMAGESYLFLSQNEIVWEYTIGAAPVAVAPLQVKKISQTKTRNFN